MKYIVLFFIVIINFRPVFSQNIIIKDSSNKNFKIYTGEIRSNIFEDGCSTYELLISEYYNFIEISTKYWKTINLKYRLENQLCCNTFSVTKTLFRDRETKNIFYIAIDSSVAKKIIKSKNGYNYSDDDKIYKDINITDDGILPLFLSIIRQHNLQAEFLKFDPKSYVGWLKVNP